MYIRTKDGVYEVDEVKPYFLDENQKLFINNELRIAINENQVIAQSENLEELCDEFVIHRKEMNYNFVWNKERNVGFYYFCSFPEKYDVYGCIWTDKGLIYVAKMDSDGKLVLI